MVKIIVCIVFCLSFLQTNILADQKIDELTYAAFKAFESYHMNPDLKKSSNTTSSFVGCAGDVSHFNCINKVNMELTFSGNEISGICQYVEIQLSIKFEGYEDKKGNILLVEKTPKNFINYQFKGKHDKSGIRGLWSKGGGKKQFALNVKEFAEKK